jgi:hypothetical protein
MCAVWPRQASCSAVSIAACAAPDPPKSTRRPPVWLWLLLCTGAGAVAGRIGRGTPACCVQIKWANYPGQTSQSEACSGDTRCVAVHVDGRLFLALGLWS